MSKMSNTTNTFYFGNSTSKYKPAARPDWTSNIDSILRLTQRNLKGIDRFPVRMPEEYIISNKEATQALVQEEGLSQYHVEEPIRMMSSRGPRMDASFSRFGDSMSLELKTQLVAAKESLLYMQKQIESELAVKLMGNESFLDQFSAHLRESKQSFEKIQIKLDAFEFEKQTSSEDFKNQLNDVKDNLQNFLTKGEFSLLNEQTNEELELKLSRFKETLDECWSLKQDVERINQQFSDIHTTIDAKISDAEERNRKFVNKLLESASTESRIAALERAVESKQEEMLVKFNSMEKEYHDIEIKHNKEIEELQGRFERTLNAEIMSLKEENENLKATIANNKAKEAIVVDTKYHELLTKHRQASSEIESSDKPEAFSTQKIELIEGLIQDIDSRTEELKVQFSEFQRQAKKGNKISEESLIDRDASGNSQTLNENNEEVKREIPNKYNILKKNKETEFSQKPITL